MTIFRSHKTIIIWTVIIGLYLTTRLINLGAIPIFTDEAIYLHWSQAIASDIKFLYLPLTDGKPPLFMWTTAVVMKLLPAIDPLYAGRAISVVSGLAAMIGIFFTSWQFFKNKRVAYLATTIYIFLPFTFFYDRFGLVDSMLAMWGIWALGLGILLVKNLRMTTALILGTVIGLGQLTKTPALFFLIFLVPLMILLDFKKDDWRKRFIHLAGLYLVVFAVSRFWYSLLIFLPQAYVVSLKNQEFIISFSDFVSNPLRLLSGNTSALIRWQVSYLTWPLLAPLAIAIFGRKYFKQKIILIGCFGVYFLFLAIVNKVIYPRYLLLSTPLLIILVSLGITKFIDRFKNKIVVAVVLSALAILPIFTDYKLLVDPASAPIADDDSEQYLNGWPAGWGVNSARSFFQGESKRYGKITLGVEGTFGLMPYALDIYHQEYPNLEVKSYWPEPDVLPSEIAQVALDHPTYYIIYQREKTPKYDGKMELVAKYEQGRSQHFLKLYRITPRS